jgi:hypothetical protein
MSLVHELDDAVGQIQSLLEDDTDADTNLMNWPDEAWAGKKVLTDDLVLAKVHPVIYVSATSTEIIIETIWREPTDTTDSKRELTKLVRRVEEVLRRNRISAPYWTRSVFHETGEPLRCEIYRLSVEQHTMIGAVLFWHGYRRVQLT